MHRSTKLLPLINLFSYISFATLNPVIVPALRRSGLTDSNIGLVISVGAISLVLGSLAWPRLLRRMDTRSVIAFGLSGMLIGFLLFAYCLEIGLARKTAKTTLFLILLLSRSIINGSFSAIPIAVQSLCASLTSAGRDRLSIVSKLNLANGIGLLVGPVLGGIASFATLMTPFWFVLVWPLLGLFVVFLIPPSTHEALEQSSINNWQKNYTVRHTLLLGTALLAMTTIGANQVIISLAVEDLFKISLEQVPRYAAITVLFAGIGYIVAQFISLKSSSLPIQWHHILGLFLTGASLGLICYATSFINFVMLFFSFGLGSGLLVTGYTTALTEEASQNNQQGIAGLLNTVQGLGAIAGPSLGTVLYHVTPRLPFAAFSLSLFITFLISLIYIRR